MKSTLPYKVVSFYTEHDVYAEHVERLRRSLVRFDIPHQLTAIRTQGRWEQICALKSQFILEKWEQSDTAVVWLDADATVESPPNIFSSIESDFAIHKWDGWRFGSGTLYFGKTEPARDLLRQWVFRCKADPMTWDQVHLQSAWCDIAAQGRLKTFWLPRSYLQIHDAEEQSLPVIKHWQASRQINKDPKFLDHSERGIELRRRQEPWRTSEAAFWISEGTEHIIPDIGQKFPEGDFVETVIRRCVAGHWPMLEIGCGEGRIASLFEPSEYIGAELNPAALLKARHALPAHNLRISDDGYRFPEAPSVLLYTVLLHISDDTLTTFLAECCAGRKRVIFAEVMDNRWRRDGNPPVFNRAPEQYVLEMQNLGFKLAIAEKHAYERYDKEPWNIGRDSRITFLVFDVDNDYGTPGT